MPHVAVGFKDLGHRRDRQSLADEVADPRWHRGCPLRPRQMDAELLDDERQRFEREVIRDMADRREAARRVRVTLDRKMRGMSYR